MHAHAFCLLAVGQVEAKGSDRGPQPSTHSIAVHGLEIAYAIRRIAGVDEYRDSPSRTDPAYDFSARQGIVAPDDGGIADARPEALKGITAHRGVASGAEQEWRRDAIRRRCDNRPSFRTKRELSLDVERNPSRELRDTAAEGARGHGRGAATQLRAEGVSFSRRQQIVDAAPRVSHLGVQRMRTLQHDVGRLLSRDVIERRVGGLVAGIGSPSNPSEGN